MTLPADRFASFRSHQRAVALVTAAVIVLGGCGGGSISSSMPTSPPPSVPENASVTGQYNVVLTSATGHATTNIYTNLTQIGATFTGAPNTLVCPSNDLSQCIGDGSPAASITPTGAVRGETVTMTISFPAKTGPDTVTMAGTATGTNLAGSYTDSSGDSGTWTASTAIHPFGPPPGVYNYSGTFNSTANPLVISPKIFIELGRDATANLTGKATIMNSPCIGSLTLSGQAIGDAFSVTDATNKLRIIALPTQPTLPAGDSFAFRYQFDATAANCAGDLGRGVLTINPSPFDY